MAAVQMRSYQLDTPQSERIVHNSTLFFAQISFLGVPPDLVKLRQEGSASVFSSNTTSDESLNPRRVVKIFNLEDNQQQIQATLEARAYYNFAKHHITNIPTFYGAVLYPNYRFALVLEECSPTLHEKFFGKDSAPLPNLPQILRTAQCLLSSLMGIHQLGMAHLHIQPRTATQEKLLNFSYVRLIEHIDQSLPNDQSILPPEVLVGKKDFYSSAIDMWQLGCLLYMLFAGKSFLPFNARLSSKKNVCLALHYIHEIIGEVPQALLSGSPLAHKEGLSWVPNKPKSKSHTRLGSNFETGRRARLSELVDAEREKRTSQSTPSEAAFDPENQFEDFKKLLFGLLNPDPEERLTAEQALLISQGLDPSCYDPSSDYKVEIRGNDVGPANERGSPDLADIPSGPEKYLELLARKEPAISWDRPERSTSADSGVYFEPPDDERTSLLGNKPGCLGCVRRAFKRIFCC